MKKTIATLGIAGTLIGGGIDASSLREAPIEKVEMVAFERVEVKQRKNVVETKLPWKGEEGITVKYDMGEPTASERLKDKRKKQVITEVTNFGEGGFKVDVILDEKPDTNRFCYLIEGAENYDFFYQPELTEEQEKRGEYRSEDIVGSYAVYHKTLKNNGYKTGKVMHIPRPQVWEVNNKEATKEWAELSYANGELCVTARQEFLNTATYPVRIDPTFGYTSQGASDATLFSGGADNAAAMRGDVSGTVTAIAAYIKYLGFSAGSKAFALSTNNAGVPNSTFAYTSSYSAVTSTSYTLESISGLSQVITNPYWVLVVGASGGFSGRIAYDTGGAAGYGAYRNDVTVWNSDSNMYSVYATYTASGGGAPSITNDLIIFE